MKDSEFIENHLLNPVYCLLLISALSIFGVYYFYVAPCQDHKNRYILQKYFPLPLFNLDTDFISHPNSSCSGWHKNGFMAYRGQYMEGNLDGYWQSNFENGNQRLTANLKNGWFDGEIKIFYENGNLALSGHYSNYKKDKKWKTFHRNGVLNEEYSFLDGEIIGLYVSHYDNGQLKEKSNFEKFKMTENLFCRIRIIDFDIDEFVFFRKGEIPLELFELNGTRAGQRVYFDIKGKIIKKESYDNGLLVEKL